MISLIAALTLQATELPSCDSLEYEGTHENCVLVTANGATASFVFEPGGWGDAGTLTLADANGEAVLSESFETESFFYPSLSDLDGDGIEDILVPLITGNVNTEYRLIMSGEDGYTVARREISGHSLDPVTPGLFVAVARSSAVEHFASFYAWDGATLDLEAAVSITFRDENTSVCALATGFAGRGEDFYCGAVMHDAEETE